MFRERAETVRTWCKECFRLDDAGERQAFVPSAAPEDMHVCMKCYTTLDMLVGMHIRKRTLLELSSVCSNPACWARHCQKGLDFLTTRHFSEEVSAEGVQCIVQMTKTVNC